MSFIKSIKDSRGQLYDRLNKTNNKRGNSLQDRLYECSAKTEKDLRNSKNKIDDLMKRINKADGSSVYKSERRKH